MENGLNLMTAGPFSATSVAPIISRTVSPRDAEKACQQPGFEKNPPWESSLTGVTSTLEELYAPFQGKKIPVCKRGFFVSASYLSLPV